MKPIPASYLPTRCTQCKECQPANTPISFASTEQISQNRWQKLATTSYIFRLTMKQAPPRVERRRNRNLLSETSGTPIVQIRNMRSGKVKANTEWRSTYLRSEQYLPFGNWWGIRKLWHKFTHFPVNKRGANLRILNEGTQGIRAAVHRGAHSNLMLSRIVQESLMFLLVSLESFFIRFLYALLPHASRLGHPIWRFTILSAIGNSRSRANKNRS